MIKSIVPLECRLEVPLEDFASYVMAKFRSELDDNWEYIRGQILIDVRGMVQQGVKGLLQQQIQSEVCSYVSYEVGSSSTRNLIKSAINKEIKGAVKAATRVELTKINNRKAKPIKAKRKGVA